MGFSSMDDLISKVSTDGQFARLDWNKNFLPTTAAVAGEWHCLVKGTGNPSTGSIYNTGTNLAFQATSETTANAGGIPHGGNVSPDTKHILNVSALSAVATAVPAQLMLVDLQGYWPTISNNTTSPQTLLGTPTLRYTNGAGCRLFQVQTAVAGATAQNMALSYTDQAGNTGNTLPVTVAMTASAIAGHISHSGTAANNYGPFLPLANGDTGVQNVATVTMSAANTGTFALCLAKPLLTIPLTTVSVAAERDLVNQLPSMPQVKDGACLVWLYFAGAATGANTNFYLSTEFAWG